MKYFKIIIDDSFEYGPYEEDMAHLVAEDFEKEGVNPDIIKVIEVKSEEDDMDYNKGYRVTVDGVVDEDFGETYHKDEAEIHAKWLEEEEGINPDIIKVEELDWSDDENDGPVNIDYNDPKQTGELDTSGWDLGREKQSIKVEGYPGWKRRKR